MDAQTPRFASEDEEAAWALSLLREGSRAEKIDARDRLAYIFERRNLLDAAIECLESNVRDGVRDPRVYQRLAGIYRRQGLEELADEALDEARSLEQRRREEGSAVRRIDDLADESDAGGHPLEAPTRPLPAAVAPVPDLDRPEPRFAEPRPWYTTPAVLTLAILVCGPFGIALLWLRTRFSSRAKWMVTGAWLALNALAFLAGWSILQANLEPIIAQTRIAPMPATQTPGGLPLGKPGPAPSPGGVAVSPGAALPPSPAAPAVASSPSPAAVGTIERVRIVDTGGQGANLRERPSSTAPRIKVLTEGTVVEVVGADQQAEGRGWRNVRDPTGATGWVAADFVEPAP